MIKAGICGKLFLVDPLNWNLDIAKKRISDLKFDNFFLVPCALSNSTGKQIFYTNLDKNLSGHDSLYDMSSIGYHEQTVKTEVDVKKLDDLCNQIGIRKIHFLKIDVEGNELFVLKGAENYLTRGSISFVQFEFGNSAKAARVYLHQIVYYLESRQFKIFIIKPKGLLPLKFSPFTEMRYSYINFLAVHNDSLSSISEIVIDR